MILLVEITDGWNGNSISRHHAYDEYDAQTTIMANAPDKSEIADAWSFTKNGEAEIVDYGSHRYFGRITEDKEAEAYEESWKEFCDED